MEPELLDCHWCGSARSIEFGICQVCLMEYAVDTKVIELPTERLIDRRQSREKIEVASAE